MSMTYEVAKTQCSCCKRADIMRDGKNCETGGREREREIEMPCKGWLGTNLLIPGEMKCANVFNKLTNKHYQCYEEQVYTSSQ